MEQRRKHKIQEVLKERKFMIEEEEAKKQLTKTAKGKSRDKNTNNNKKMNK